MASQEALQKLNDPVYFQVAFLDKVPYDKQVAFLRHPAKHKILVTGRRTGKTEIIVVGDGLRGALLGIYKRQAILAPNYRHLQTVYRKFLTELYANDLVKEIKVSRENPSPYIEFINGSELHFMQTDKPLSIRGEAFDRIFEDESPFIKDNARDAIRPLAFDKGAPTIKCGTPWSTDTEFYVEYQQALSGKHPNRFAMNFSTLDNPFISQETVQEEIDRFGIDSPYIQAEIYGNFIQAQDLFFNPELIQDCIDREYEVHTDISQVAHPKAVYVMGVDYARMGEDSNVIVILEKPFGSEDVYVKRVDVICKVTLDKMVDRINYLARHYSVSKIYCDSTGLGAGPTDMIASMTDLKGKVADINFGGNIDGKPAKEVIYNNLKRMLLARQRKSSEQSDADRLMEQNPDFGKDPKLLKHIDTLNAPNGGLHLFEHPQLIYELMQLRYEIRPNGRLMIHHPDQGHDDHSDALALAALYFRKEQTRGVRRPVGILGAGRR